MSTTPPTRRVTLAQGYRDLGEKQIRARLDEGGLTEVERVIAQAELLRRGAGEEFHDTAPGSRFAPTSALDLIETGQDAAVEEVDPPPAARGGRRGWGIVVLLALAVAITVAVMAGQGWLRHGGKHRAMSVRAGPAPRAA